MRMPNTAIICERHPMPTADELIHKLNGAKVFSKLDLCHRYHQILLAPESRYITTFRTHKGLHRYVRLNYGTSAASEVFQYAISQAIAGIDGVVNISEDVLIFGKTQLDHDTALKTVFERLRQVDLTLNKSKCAYNKGTLEFFGMIFSADGVSPDPKKIEAIVNAPRPTNVSGVHSLLDDHLDDQPSDEEEDEIVRNEQDQENEEDERSEKLNLPDSVARKRRKLMLEHAEQMNSRPAEDANHRKKCALDGMWSTLVNSANVHDIKAYMEVTKGYDRNNSLNCEQCG
ncbi:Transposon Ty3-I Gag-Pol poly [Paramuricea clavata]|uniref:Transposon Ty3-I Gag-Pol poly n=1 Tax=Paramuricea clavata TaxID=317549 RepID=A0A6S7J409_PARCT|nr:Transposon Ty3-I Gag-Pol poly [Paramuricea clavata]